jgi:hypothetical protein
MGVEFLTLKSWEDRSARFGPQRQPFFFARFSDGSSRMVAGLAPREIVAFFDQHHEAGTPREEAKEILRGLARHQPWVETFIAYYEAAEASQTQQKAVPA